MRVRTRPLMLRRLRRPRYASCYAALMLDAATLMLLPFIDAMLRFIAAPLIYVYAAIIQAFYDGCCATMLPTLTTLIIFFATMPAFF